MTPDQKRVLEDLRQWRLNQPYMSSEEALEQMQRIRRNVQARSESGATGSETPSSIGQSDTDASRVAENT